MTNDNNQVAKRMESGAVAVADPFSSDQYHMNADSVIRSMTERKAKRVAEFNDLGDIDQAPLAAVKELRRAIAEDDDALKNYEKTLKDALLELSGFKAVVVQMKGAKVRIDPISVRGKFAEMIKTLKEREEAEKVVEPPRSWVIRVDANGEQFTKLAEAAKKAGCPFQHFATAQSDKAVKQIAKWFEENM